MQALDTANRDRIIFSQFSQNELGLYMAANKDWKYVYSAADDKEWLYDLVNDPLEIENLFGEPDYAAQAALLKNACIRRFQIDGYTEPLEGDDWKAFQKAAPPSEFSDDGLLFQDPEELEKEIHALGQYARSAKFIQDSRFNLLNKLCEVSQPTKDVH